MSQKARKIDKSKLEPIHALQRERRLIIKELEAQGPMTIPELSRTTELETESVFKHIIALKQLGRIRIVGEKKATLCST